MFHCGYKRDCVTTLKKIFSSSGVQYVYTFPHLYCLLSLPMHLKEKLINRGHTEMHNEDLG